MKSKWIIVPVMLGVFTVFSTNGFSQRDNLKDKKEQIKQERKDFINRWCGFTDSESSKFWQLHDEMETRQNAIRKENKKALNEIKDKGIDNISEADLKKAMDNQHGNEQKQLDLRWEYNQKFIDAVYRASERVGWENV